MEKKFKWWAFLFNILITVFASFGMFCYYIITDMNPIFSLFAALIVAALTSVILYIKT